MIPLLDLWLPILVSAIGVFLASSIIHMALPIHKSDYRKMPNEESVMAAIRAANIAPGEYMFPMCGSMKDMSSPEFVAKLNQGPVGSIVVRPKGPCSMGKSLGQWFAFCIVIAIFVAYIAGIATPRGATFAQVFRVAGAAAVLGHAFGSVSNSIWKGIEWGITFKFVFDGVVYGLVTAAVFGWLWPGVAPMG